MPKRPSAPTLVLAIALAGPALAEPGGKDGCVDAHLSAQRSRKNGQLLDAREALRVCARPECPQMLVADCGSWLAEVSRAIPSIVIRARTPAGADLRDVRVVIDGHVRAQTLDGKGIDVDPGEHRLRLEHRGSSVERLLVVAEGEHARAVDVPFDDEKPAPEAKAPAGRPSGGPSVLGWSLVAAGAAGIGTSVAFAVLGWNKKSELDDLQCKPACPESEVDAGRRYLLIADIAGALGVAAVGAGTYLIIDSSMATRSAGMSFRGRF